ncbi:MAG: hypothetical protein KME27_08050 [Lyngbya sp. HA4199-MV5]|nr:hypothetical protein [Lyngbya sp. HA4199-MV5]
MRYVNACDRAAQRADIPLWGQERSQRLNLYHEARLATAKEQRLKSNVL